MIDVINVLTYSCPLSAIVEDLALTLTYQPTIGSFLQEIRQNKTICKIYCYRDVNMDNMTANRSNHSGGGILTRKFMIFF